MLDRAQDTPFILSPTTAPQPSYDPAILAAALHCSLLQGQMLCLMLSKPLTSISDLEQRFGLSIEGRRTAIHRLRERLGRVKVSVISHHGLGYSITHEDRGRIFAIVDKFKGNFE